MLRTTTRRPARPRRGAILLVVITLLALFAVIGLSFALYADAEATAARTAREAQSNVRDGTDIEAALNPGQAFNDALSQVLFGVSDADGQSTSPNEQRRLQSGFRGYSFARLMYGQPRTVVPGTPPKFQHVPLLSPYTGLGLFASTDGLSPMTTLPGIPTPVDRTKVINYAYLPGAPNTTYIIDPEYSWFRLNPLDTNPAPGNPDPRGNWYKNVSAPYTYPDLKDLNLAVINPLNGRVLQPSFFRDYAFNAAQPNAALRLAPPPPVNPTGPNNGITDPNQDDWLRPAGRLVMVRPRPIDHLYDPDGVGPLPANIEFPYPPPNADGSYSGDVTNYPGVQNNQRHDSVWVYPGGAIRSFRGKRYTALIAPLIIDLGGRVNLAVAGNLKANLTDHASNQGGGTHEINPRWAFDPNATTRTSPVPPGWLPLTANSQLALQQLLGGNNFATASGTFPAAGRYGVPVRTPPNILPPADRLTLQPRVQFNGGRLPPVYGGADPDGASTATLPPPGDRALPAGSGTSPWPGFPETRYPNGANDPTGTLTPVRLATELGNHPGQYNPEYYSRLIAAANGGGFGPFLPIEERVMGSKYAGVPEPYSRTDAGKLAPDQLISANLLTGPSAPPFNPYATPTPNPQTTTTDDANVTRAITTLISTSLNRAEVIVRTGPESTPGANDHPKARLGPVDVNRPMPDYRDPNNPLNVPNPKMLGPDNMGNWPKAQAARQRLARDIFVRLASLYPKPNDSTGAKVIDGDTVYYVAGAPTNPNPVAPNYTDPFIDHGYLRVLPTATPESIDLLRKLAQVAVNIVDYLDPDDVSTTFTWRPWNPQFPTDGYILHPAVAPSVPQPVTDFHVTPGLSDTTATQATPAAPGTILKTELGNHVVYGTEAPRLALNEVYAALTNVAADHNPAKGNPGTGTVTGLEKRLWIELYNPMRADPALSENGLTRLHYPTGVFGVTNPYSPYMVVVTSAPTNPFRFAEAANVTGSPRHATVTGTTIHSIVDQYLHDAANGFPADPSQDAQIDEAATYSPLYPPLTNPPAPGNFERFVVRPHAGSGAGTPGTNLNGFCVLGPVENFPGQYAANDPGAQMKATIRIQPMPSVTDPAVMSSLRIPVTTGTDDAAITANTTDPAAAVTVLLRRLANPHLPPNDPLEPSFVAGNPVNPYVTVDMAERVQPVDNVHFSSTNPTADRMGPTGLVATASVGRRHPFAADVIDPQQAEVPPGAAVSPKSTFFNHNDNSGLTASPVTPLKWLVHLDRQLISPIELAHVSAVSPGRLTTEFGEPNPGDLLNPFYNKHSLEKLLIPGVSGGVNPEGIPTPPPPGYLSQLGFFDVLQARGPQPGVPVGGRAHGKINLNAAWHPAVLRALLDRNDANYFRDLDVAETNPTTPETNDRSAWSRMTMANNAPLTRSGHRSQAWPNVLPTDPALPPTQRDTPFQGMDDVIHRGFDPNGTDALLYPPVARPLFHNQNPADTVLALPASAQDHTAVLAEPLKKLFNNATTTSDGFLVIMTVAFFEVRNDPALSNGRVYLGKELYEQVPGDRRYRFFSIVDRTQLALEPPVPPATPPVPVQYLQAAATPWQTTLAEDVLPGATTIKVMASTKNPTNDSTIVTNAHIYVDGVEVPLLAATTPTNYQRIRIGYGEAGYARPLPATLPPGQPAVSPLKDGGDGEEVALTSLPPATPTPIPQVVSWSNGVATIALAAPAVGYHPAGSPVGNYVLGNPGPQPTFDPNSPQYKPVVPYFARQAGQ